MTSRRARTDRLSGAPCATSTTLDVVLCLLLVSTAVGVLAAAGPPPEPPDARTAGFVANRLTSTSVVVDYELAAANDGERPVGARRRAAHGTPAGLLARAAIADVAVHGGDETAGSATVLSSDLAAQRAFSRPADEGPGSHPRAFERAATDRTNELLAAMGVDERTNVTATYAPVAGSGVVGRTSVGPRAPRDADVTVARVRVPVGSGPRPAMLERAATASGFAGLARAAADATVATLAPPSRTRWALRDPGTRGPVLARYGRLGRALGVDLAPALDGGRVRRANDLLARALADRYVAALREHFDAPTDATTANAVRPRVVTVTVRTWSR